MNRTIRAIIGALLVLVIIFSAISICQSLGGRFKFDVTEQKIFSLSNGSKAILARLNQPLTVKLYYAKTAAMEGPDQIRYFNNYYEFVRALLHEYVAASKGMVKLEIIDPRPFSEEEVEALQYGLRRFPITEEENFFFGLVVQTQFGVEKVIPFFSPDRQNFVEYDISQLIDGAITRQKTRIGIMSSLPVMGQDVTPYMAQMMRMQGRQPEPPWTIVEQLRSKYQVKDVPTDVNDINDVDLLLVIHPKDLPEKTLFAIDQFVLKGGRTIVCVDPYCIVDQPDQMAQQLGQTPSQSSNLEMLLNKWGLQMPENTFAGDMNLALRASLSRDQRLETIIGFLNLSPPNCFNKENVITSELNQVRVLFAGVLKEIADVNDSNQPLIQSGAGPARIERTPLLMTTAAGNSWNVTNPFELRFLQPEKLMDRFFPGTKPVVMGYLVTGRFKSGFPDGIEIKVEPNDSNEPAKTSKDPNAPEETRRITGLTEAAGDCAAVVFSDVDFISDVLAYQKNTFFGNIVVGDNSALLLNTIDELSGSSDLISIRSRGNYQRPFVVVDNIEKQAEAETAGEVAKLNAEIAGFTNELQSILSSAKDKEAEVVGGSILQKQRELELKRRQAQRELRQVNMRRRQHIEHLGNILRNFNMLAAPAVILVIAVVLGVRRGIRKRHYIGHASDA